MRYAIAYVAVLMGVVSVPFVTAHSREAVMYVPTRCITAVHFTKRCRSITASEVSCDGVRLAVACVAEGRFSEPNGSLKREDIGTPYLQGDVLRTMESACGTGTKFPQGNTTQSVPDAAPKH